MDLLRLMMIIMTLVTMIMTTPVRFMCDVCEGNFVQCMVHCSIERFITRDQFDRSVVFICVSYNFDSLNLIRSHLSIICRYLSFILVFISVA